MMKNEQSLLINRDLSWLEFNRRVLEEAKDPGVPLLERVKFLAIFSSNLDEFFMVRVAGLKRRVKSSGTTSDGIAAASVITAIAQKVRELTDEQHVCFLDTILPQLAAEGLHLLRPEEISREQEQFLEDYFRKTLYPIVTPLAIDPGHPFPYLANRSLCLVLSLHAKDTSPLPHTELSIVHIPAQVVPRFVALPGSPGQYAFILLEDVIRLHLSRLYHGYEIVSCHAVRVTRDSELELAPGDQDLLTSVEESLRERRMGSAVRLQHDPDLPDDILAMLVQELELQPEDLYGGEGFTAFSDLFQLYASVDVRRLKDQAWLPHAVSA